MSNLIELAVLLQKAGRLTIIAPKVLTGKETRITIQLNRGDIYDVSDDVNGASQATIDAKSIVDGNNLNFYYSTNGMRGNAQINRSQNQDVLFEEANAVLGYLPYSCYPNGAMDADIDSDDKTVIKEELGRLFKNVADKGSFSFKQLKKSREENEVTYDELFQTKVTLWTKDRKGTKETLFFRVVPPRDAEGQIIGAAEEDEVCIKPATILLEGDEGTSVRNALTAMNPQLLTNMGGRSNEYIWQSLQTGLTQLVNEQEIFSERADANDIGEVETITVKYWKLYGARMKAEAKISSETSLFQAIKEKGEAKIRYYFSYVKQLEDKADLNFYQCPAPFCGKGVAKWSGSAGVTFYADPNLRKDEEEDSYYAVGCTCMSAECGYCGQKYFRKDKYAALQAYYRYDIVPEKRFFENDPFLSQMLEREETLINSGKNVSVSIGDFCACQQDVTWFYDEMFRKEHDQESFDRAVLLRDAVFVNRFTKEVVAAFSEGTLSEHKSEMDRIYNPEDGENKNEVGIFFLDYLKKKSNIVKRLFSDGGKAEDAPRVNDLFTSRALKENGVKKEDFRVELGDALRDFKKKLAKAIFGKSSHKYADAILMTSIYRCKMCRVCGGLYYVEGSSGDVDGNGDWHIPMLSQSDPCSDRCLEEGSEGKWMAGGAYYYKEKGAQRVKVRTVLTKKGEITYQEWQEGVCRSLGISK